MYYFQAVPIPSTPESKMSFTSSSLCFSPDKLEGILIRRKSTASPAMISNDTESPQSTPVKKKTAPAKLHLLSCGLDSPGKFYMHTCSCVFRVSANLSQSKVFEQISYWSECNMMEFILRLSEHYATKNDR